MTTTATSFASLHGDIINHGGGGVIEISNRYGFPSIYCLRLLPGKVLVQRLLLEMLLRVLAMSLMHLSRQLDLSF